MLLAGCYPELQLFEHQVQGIYLARRYGARCESITAVMLLVFDPQKQKESKRDFQTSVDQPNAHLPTEEKTGSLVLTELKTRHLLYSLIQIRSEAYIKTGNARITQQRGAFV